ncbi:MAG TPA: MogA/MoaB family molybdenum cofactor biosynthesis protein [Thermoanaerobaculia bacterium]|jgi:molybdenum cofactor synthesis domain-containing protein|nr:MogA/MoaB family molybdenum cofactor biosynthesis protein [Thermoanaerobaculia bacterium]
MPPSFIRVLIVTISDGVAAGEREDRGGPACEEALARSGIEYDVVGRRVLADDSDAISELVRTQADSGAADLIVLTGGTGLSPRDRTPEAVRRVIDLEAPGLAEKMRADTGRDFAAAYLSRQVAGVRGSTLVVALPGSPKGAADCLHAVAELLPHAIELARGERAHHPLGSDPRRGSDPHDEVEET